MTPMPTWAPYDEGRTIGLRGGEGGTIIRDEQHEAGARITLETRCLRAPVAINVVVQDWLLHTRFFLDERTAQEAYEAMKTALEKGIFPLLPAGDLSDEDADVLNGAIAHFMEQYP